MTAFSFHPVKHITTGEGGLIATDDDRLAARLRVFRNHGITTDHRQRSRQGAFFYEMVDLGFNYRITDFQCALGASQLRKLPGWLQRREEIARAYDQRFARIPGIRPLERLSGRSHAWHLYVVRIDPAVVRPFRADVFTALRNAGIGANVHYIPVHLHPFYRKRFGYGEGLCPVAEKAYEQILSLPIYPGMTDGDVARVGDALESAVNGGAAAQ